LRTFVLGDDGPSSSGRAGRTSAEGLRFFGEEAGDAGTRQMAIRVSDPDGTALYAANLAPNRGK
jgi:hypothetical protein